MYAFPSFLAILRPSLTTVCLTHVSTNLFPKSVEGYMSLNTEFHDGNPGRQGGRRVQQLKGGRLSITQLLLRRGLTMFAAVTLLAVGASVHFLVPQTQPSGANFTSDWINTTYSPEHIISTSIVLVPNEETDWPWRSQITTMFLFNVLNTNSREFDRMWLRANHW